MARKGVDVRHQLYCTLPGSGAADAAGERDTQAAVAALVGADDQLGAKHTVEARPI